MWHRRLTACEAGDQAGCSIHCLSVVTPAFPGLTGCGLLPWLECNHRPDGGAVSVSGVDLGLRKHQDGTAHANYYPWLRLEKRGVEVTWLSIYDSLQEIGKAAEGARLLAISYINYLSGYRVDLNAIGEICRRNGCFFFVDAIQGMGALPLDVETSRIDALAADGHKWMLGPEGNGVLYVRRECQDRIEPVEFGWTNPANYADYSSRDMTLRSDAGRYECGTLNTVGCFGQRAAIDFLLEVGIDKIAPAVLARAGQLESGVRSKGYEVMAPRTEETGSGIVSFRHPHIDCRAIVSQLKKNRITAAPRQGWIRMSPHFYISPDDIRRVLETLPTV